MSFFKDFKEDLSQAVNELMPEETAAPKKDESQMVDTLTVDTLEEEDNEPSIEEMLNNIEDIDVNNLEDVESAAEPVVEETSEEPEPVIEPESVIEPEPIMEPEPVVEPEPEESPKFVEEEPVIEQEVTQVAEEVNIDPNKATDETGLITAGMTIKGDIITTGSLEILGAVEGDIDVKGKLEVAGTIQGNSKAADVYAESAMIVGEIISSGPVKIGQNSIVKGNITAKAAVCAGAVKGDIDVQGPVILDTTAIIMGNIKSKSIQINNGAVVEGLCSNCYADMNPSEFFEDKAKSTSKSKK